MGYVAPPTPAPRLNLDRFGLPRDYASYVWLLYGKRVTDDSPARLAFLHSGLGLKARFFENGAIPDFGVQYIGLSRDTR